MTSAQPSAAPLSPLSLCLTDNLLLSPRSFAICRLPPIQFMALQLAAARRAMLRPTGLAWAWGCLSGGGRLAIACTAAAAATSSDRDSQVKRRRQFKWNEIQQDESCMDGGEDGQQQGMLRMQMQMQREEQRLAESWKSQRVSPR